MSIDRVRMLPNEKEIILLRGFDPVIDDKVKTQELPKFREAMSLGKYEYGEYHSAAFFVDADGPLSNAELEQLLTTGAATIGFSPGEWESLPEDAFDTDYTEEDAGIDWEFVIHHLHLGDAYEEAYPGLGAFPDRLKERILQDDFTKEQLLEAKEGFEQGLDESQVLCYFDAANTPERMKAARIVLAGRSGR